MTTLEKTNVLLGDVDAHLREASNVLRNPCCPQHAGELRVHVDGLLDFRLVLMAARDHLARRPAPCSLPPAPRA